MASKEWIRGSAGDAVVWVDTEAAAPVPVTVSSRLLHVKRAFDFLAAIGLIVLLAPLMLVIAAAISLETEGPPIYVDIRRGRNGCVFPMLKFRTMHVGAAAQKSQLLALNAADPPLFKIQNDPRVTRIGKFLRRSSLDELPQLLNVVLGQMSLIGPRPFVIHEADSLGDRGTQRMLMRPGMSGPWQVAGRAELSTDELIRLDNGYVENWTLCRDIRLMARTLRAIISGEGAY